MKIKFTFLCLLLSRLVFAQGAADLESRFGELQSQIETQQTRLDSLNALLDQQAEGIEADD